MHLDLCTTQKRNAHSATQVPFFQSSTMGVQYGRFDALLIGGQSQSWLLANQGAAEAVVTQAFTLRGV